MNEDSPLDTDGAARIEARVSSLSGRGPLTVQSVLDTGATYCLISSGMASDLGLEPNRKVRQLTAGGYFDVNLYRVNVEVSGRMFEIVGATEVPTDERIFVLGRVVLKNLVFTYSGVNGRYQLSDNR